MLKLLSFFILFIITNQYNFQAKKILPKLYPILLVPGLGGSKLIKNNIDIWPPKIKYYLFNHNEWKNIMINDIENVTTLEFGDNKAFDLHSNLHHLIKRNLFDNIIKNNNTYSIPYDFRLINKHVYLDNFYHKLEKYIESFNEPITLLCHSNGGLIMHYFLHNKSIRWRKKYIKCVINVNVPFAGSIIPLREIIKITVHNIFINKMILKSLGGMIINLPNSKIIKPTLLIDDIEHENYFKFFNLEDCRNIKIIESFSKPTNIDTIIIYASEIQTPSLISVNNKKISIMYGPGDGVVPITSLLFPQKWNQKNLQFYHLAKCEHSNILFSKELLTIINSIF
jgi:hypothetical protein